MGEALSGSGAPWRTDRAALLSRLAEPVEYDLAVVGGGATGLGVALDAATRGLRVALVEARDFAKGTSSRATKLIHGGVRYLAQGNFPLVREALRERQILLRNAPHLAQPLPFVVPAYHLGERPFYGTGLVLYDALAGKAGLGRTRWLDARATLARQPALRAQGLRGGIEYWDGQFDDARMAIALARTAAQAGALLLNYCAAVDFIREGGKVAGLRCEDAETGRSYGIRAKCVVNAAGIWVDAVRGLGRETPQAEPTVTFSQGAHIVVPRTFLPGDRAVLIPRTRDGRVLFALPWMGRTVIGTTDTPRPRVELEPRPLSAEVAFLLDEAGRYLARAPGIDDISSAWAGLRPLVRPGGFVSTKNISREHQVRIDGDGLVTVAGGKWTTYRAMAEDTVDACIAAGLLKTAKSSATADWPLVGAAPGRLRVADMPDIRGYGSEQEAVLALHGAQRDLGGGLTEAMVRFAARHEYARTVEDVLARRSRLLFLDARLARAVAAEVGRLLREETGADPCVEAFCGLAEAYLRWPEEVSSSGSTSFSR
ncbi:FAD-dependent oxidoreductase [Pigmentiphaga sp. NML080357]|uniref:glycerol-3-phosphate dehydrogenase/oxidase n=1 Tax=Pigmentiphaga sp. NML080357 TaxID=2008675 RepID=UPI000B415FEE|nr:glycerol-3-phosphate dehydrogenase/oxidase [Pigmentiphaga sp. NML080357]OVZ61012.1 FAD-dependent oxidoreductase [Pigmentiphaga sp. NML080357]